MSARVVYFQQEAAPNNSDWNGRAISGPLMLDLHLLLVPARHSIRALGVYGGRAYSLEV